MSVMIGVDPHKATHTAVVVDDGEVEVARRKVRACVGQAEQLLEWATGFGQQRRWAVESANGWGYLLSQQLLAAGEVVLDVPATLAARVRLLGSGRSNKNDPNDARSVAIAALRTPGLAAVARTDHGEVLRLLAKRSHDLSRARTRIACRLHALLAELHPGGIAGEIYVSKAHQLLEQVVPQTAVEAARKQIAADHVEDLGRIDAQIRATRQRIREAVAASGTSVCELFGVGPVVAATIIGYTGDVSRFATRHQFATYTGTAPVKVSSGGRVVHRLSRRGNRRLNHAIHIAAVTQIRYPTARAAPSTTANSPKARPAKKPSGLSNGGSVTPFTASSRSTPHGDRRAREGTQGRLSHPA